MKKTVFLLCLCAIATFTQAKTYSYSYKLVYPTENIVNYATYEDSLMKLDFDLRQTAIDFTLKNKGENPITIIWDKCAFLIGDDSHRVIHKGIRFMDRDKSMAETLVFPGTWVTDMMCPSDFVVWNGKEWSQNAFFVCVTGVFSGGFNMKEAEVLNQLGKEYSLIFALEMDGKTVYKKFTFKITDIRRK